MTDFKSYFVAGQLCTVNHPEYQLFVTEFGRLSKVQLFTATVRTAQISELYSYLHCFGLPRAVVRSRVLD